MSRRAATVRRNPRRSTRSKTARPVEVFYHDANTVYNAPIDVVWEFMLNGGDIHGEAHSGTLRNFDGKDLSPNCFEATYEALRGGKWYKCSGRYTAYPPVCKIAELLKGPYAGSIILFQYWPEGKGTRVDVWAHLQSNSLSAKELRMHWVDLLANAYREDIAVFPKFLEQRRKG